MTTPPFPFETITNFSMIQTFYADEDIVNKSGTVMLTSVDLYFKPLFTSPGLSGKVNPSVTVRICKLSENEPNLNLVYAGVSSTRSYNEISPGFSDASTPVTFGFNKPLTLETGQSYGIVVILDDPGFDLWLNKTGDRLVGTNSASPGSNLVKDGKLYLGTNSGTFRAQSDSDLKFAIRCAQYTANTISETYIPNNYEYFTITSANGRFIGGEKVFQVVANNQISGSDSTVTFVTGTNVINAGTANFTTSGILAGDDLVLWSNSTYRDVVEVLEVVSATQLTTTSKVASSNSTGAKWMKAPVGEVHYYNTGRNKLYLKNSNANTSLKFQANSNLLYGEDSRANCVISSVDSISVDRVSAKADTTRPATGVIKNDITFSYKSGASYLFSFNNKVEVRLNQTAVKNLTQYDAYVQSRSLEVDNTNLIQAQALDGGVGYRVNRPSAVVNTTISVNQSNVELYTAPAIQDNVMDMYVVQNIISNTYTTTDSNTTFGTVTIDSEVAGPYLAESKHITTKASFANNRFAEDVRVFMTAYRPVGTDIKVYARVHNSADPEAFDDKSWTPLDYDDNIGKYSSKDDQNDFIEYQLGLPQYSDTANTLPGTFTVTDNSNTIVTTTDPSSYVAAGVVVKLYNPLISEDYIVDVVSSSTSTTIVLENAVTNNNVVGTGFKVDRLKYYNAAFNNITNDNVSRYYNSSLVAFDKFDAMQIKIVFLSDNSYIAPRVDKIQVIGVSA